MKHKVNLIYILLLVLVCLASVLILYHTNNSAENNNTTKTTINSFIIHGVLTEFNSKGFIKTQITAEKAIHFQPQDTTELLKPTIITYTTNRIPIHIHADHGFSNKTNDKIILKGHVIVHQLSSKSSPDTVLKTTELTLYPKRSVASTEKAVTLYRPGTVIHSTG